MVWTYSKGLHQRGRGQQQMVKLLKLQEKPQAQLPNHELTSRASQLRRVEPCAMGMESSTQMPFALEFPTCQVVHTMVICHYSLHCQPWLV